jgi:YVTN family beta-propeller protein
MSVIKSSIARRPRVYKARTRWPSFAVDAPRRAPHDCRMPRHLPAVRALAAAFALAVPSPVHSQSAAKPAGTLVVSNMNDNTASIIDVATGRVLATLPTGEGPHEVAASRDGRWAIVSNYGVRAKAGNTVTVIDIPALSVVRTIDLKEYQRPHGSAFLPGDSAFIVTAQGSKAVLVVNFQTGAVTRVVPTNGAVPHMLGLSANGDRVVTGNIPDGTISVLSLGATAEPVVIKVAAQPEGVAISPDGHTAWAGSNKDGVVTIVDLRRQVVSDTLHGFGLPYRLAISPDGKTAVVTDPVKAQVRIFDAATHHERFDIAIPKDSLVATAEVPGSPSPEGVTISPDSRWGFVTLQGRNRVITIDLATGRILGWAVTGTWSDGIAYSRRVVPAR